MHTGAVPADAAAAAASPPLPCSHTACAGPPPPSTLPLPASPAEPSSWGSMPSWELPPPARPCHLLPTRPWRRQLPLPVHSSHASPATPAATTRPHTTEYVATAQAPSWRTRMMPLHRGGGGRAGERVDGQGLAHMSHQISWKSWQRTAEGT